MIIFVAGESIVVTTQINKMAVCRFVVFLSLVMVVVVPFATGKIRGIGCTPKNCKWANWERWMECDQPCGSAGIQLRHRSPNVTESCVGTACEGSAEETRPCNRVCFNGGILSGGSCQCREPYHGACCETHNIFKRDSDNLNSGVGKPDGERYYSFIF